MLASSTISRLIKSIISKFYLQTAKEVDNSIIINLSDIADSEIQNDIMKGPPNTRLKCEPQRPVV